MRKLFLGFSLLLMSQLSFGQAVDDYSIIPVSVTLNSVFRLTVVSGGNIEFVVNTIDQYTDGINSGGVDTRYHTRFTVSSSRNYNVTIKAEAANLLGSDDATHTMAVNNVGYDLISNGAGVDPDNWNITPNDADGEPAQGLTAAAVVIISGQIVPATGTGAGSATQNDFSIRWRLGTGATEVALNTMAATSLLAQNIATDRYVTNVFLELVAK
ncbi:MAG: hypothetical protein AB9846_09280 [Tenuifilaceae bacterium]